MEEIAPQHVSVDRTAFAQGQLARGGAFAQRIRVVERVRLRVVEKDSGQIRLP